MKSQNGSDDNRKSSGPFEGAADNAADLWKMKYETLEEQYTVMKNRNEQLEDRLLNLVEKVEQEKMILSNEIDQLVGRLSQANSRITALEEDCARYKKDCILAVNLLHCEPSRYVQHEKAPDILPKKMPQKNASVVRSVATFPPMAVYLPDDADLQPDDPAPIKNEKPSLATSASFTSEFVEKIRNDEHYSFVDLKRCPKCNTVQTAIARETQTEEQQAPWPKIVDSATRFNTNWCGEALI